MDENRFRNRHKVTPAVFVFILNEQNEVLLLRRANTGYMDGFYDVPSGHLEPNEALQAGAARELLEEANLTVDAHELELFHINQNDGRSVPYINFMFRAKRWSGEPKNNEPEKADDFGFFALDNLPNVTPQVRKALENLDAKEVTFSYFTAKDFQLG